MSDRLAEITPFVGIVARERAVSAAMPDLYDDVRQEGLIAAWQVLQKRPDAPRNYLIGTVKNGVGSLLRGRPSFGSAPMRGHQDVAKTSVSLTTATNGGEVLVVDPQDPQAEDGYAAADITSMVRDAVAGLDDLDRQIVFGRYWRDMSFAELAGELGRPAGTLSRRWVDSIRPELREALA